MIFVWTAVILIFLWLIYITHTLFELELKLFLHQKDVESEFKCANELFYRIPIEISKINEKIKELQDKERGIK